MERVSAAEGRQGARGVRRCWTTAMKYRRSITAAGCTSSPRPPDCRTKRSSVGFTPWATRPNRIRARSRPPRRRNSSNRCRSSAKPAEQESRSTSPYQPPIEASNQGRDRCLTAARLDVMPAGATPCSKRLPGGPDRTPRSEPCAQCVRRVADPSACGRCATHRRIQRVSWRQPQGPRLGHTCAGGVMHGTSAASSRRRSLPPPTAPFGLANRAILPAFVAAVRMHLVESADPNPTQHDRLRLL